MTGPDLLRPRLLVALVCLFAVSILIALIGHWRSPGEHRSLRRWLADVLRFTLSPAAIRLDLRTPLRKAVSRIGTDPPSSLNGFVREPRPPVRPVRAGRVAVPEPEELSTL